VVLPGRLRHLGPPASEGAARRSEGPEPCRRGAQPHPGDALGHPAREGVVRRRSPRAPAASIALTWADTSRRFVRTERLRALSSPLTEMVGALGTVVLLWYGAHLVLVGGELGGEDFIGFLAFSMKLYSPAKYLGKLPAIIQPGLVAGERIFEFLDAPIEIRDRSDARPFPGVRVRRSSSRRCPSPTVPATPVLKDISFRRPSRQRSPHSWALQRSGKDDARGSSGTILRSDRRSHPRGRDGPPGVRRSGLAQGAARGGRRRKPCSSTIRSGRTSPMAMDRRGPGGGGAAARAAHAHDFIIEVEDSATIRSWESAGPSFPGGSASVSRSPGRSSGIPRS
jgi:hypothetical protein